MLVYLFAIVTTLLSCCCSPASSFAFLPRVSRTKDAVVIDFAGVGYAPSYHGKSLYGDLADPGFVPVPSVYPYPMAYRQQQQQPNGWSYSFGYPSPIDSTNRQAVAIAAAAATPTAAATPAPAIQCGKGPTVLPARSSIAGQRVSGSAATDAKSNAWPFLVTLRKFGDADGVYFCSGSLISDSKVLLAADCLEQFSLYEMSTVTVLIGLSPASGGASPPNVQMTRRISKMVLHRQFNAFTYANDIAILTLDAPVVLSRTVGTVCLPPASTDPDQYAGVSAAIVGWGTDVATAPSTVLKQGTVSILPNSDCKLDVSLSQYVTDANICIDATDKFVCAGDIGGPVVVLSSPGTWTQIGINSFSPTADCTANSLQTRVSAFRAWIDQNIAI